MAKTNARGRAEEGLIEPDRTILSYYFEAAAELGSKDEGDSVVLFDEGPNSTNDSDISQNIQGCSANLSKHERVPPLVLGKG